MQDIKKWWKKVKLWDVIKVISWYAFKAADFIDNWTPIIKIKNIKEWFTDILNDVQYVRNDFKIDEKFIISNWDILISLTGSHISQWASVVWRVWKYNHKNIAFLNQRAWKVFCNNVDREYLYFLLFSYDMRYRIASLSNWAASQANISPWDIHWLEVIIPETIESQQKIASILSKYDDLIENNNKRIKILEETAQSIYEEWFVKYNFPWSENIKMVDSWNDDFGVIPEGWKVWRLEDYIKIIKWISYKSTELSDSWFPFVNLKCFNRWGWFRRDWIKWFTWIVKLEKKVFPWDLVMAVTDMTQWREIVARVAMIPNTINEATISCDVIKIEPKNIDKSYLYYFLRFSTFSDNTKMKANWANVLHLSPSVIWEFDIILPEKNIIKNFWIITEKIISEMDNLEIQNENLKVTRDLLIPRLVNGELDVESLDVK